MKKDNFQASFDLDDQGYFKLSIEHNFKMFAATREDLVKKLIEKINSANIIEYNEQSSKFGLGQLSKDGIDEYWSELKHIAIKSLEDEADYIFIGYDEELTIEILNIIN